MFSALGSFLFSSYKNWSTFYKVKIPLNILTAAHKSGDKPEWSNTFHRGTKNPSYI